MVSRSPTNVARLGDNRGLGYFFYLGLMNFLNSRSRFLSYF